jgi:hypothetical protein
MDVFRQGTLLKSYKIGIGYPQFPLPQGLRQAQVIIFNPTWTPPDSPWVAGMKNVTAGQQVTAGSPLNPLGPIKIPIGMPSLIHGGKAPAKIGTFASHGCVGLTNAQVKEFAKTLAQAAGKDLSDKALAGYLKDPTKTRSLKLDQPIPVELRYETIVMEDGKLHFFKDVYDQKTTTEETLKAVLAANGLTLESFSEEERNKILDGLDSMAGGAKRRASAKPVASPTVTASVNGNARAKKEATKKTAVKSQKEILIDLTGLKGKGYPAPVDLNTGVPQPKPTPAETESARK